MNQTNPIESVAAGPELGSEPLPKQRHEIFAREIALVADPRDAAERAGYPRGAGAPTRLLRRPDVRARIAWLTRQDADLIREKRRRLEAFWWRAHDLDPMTFYDGNRLRDFADIDPDDRKLIEGLTYTEKGRPNLKFVSHAQANIELRKMLGGDAAQTVDATVGFDQVIRDVAKLREARHNAAGSNPVVEKQAADSVG
jgi:hypothetical protein